MRKYYYTAQANHLTVCGDKIIHSKEDKDVVLYNTWAQRGYCKVEDGCPINSYKEALVELNDYGYQTATYYTDLCFISKRDAARIYYEEQFGESIPISKRDASKVLQKVIK